MRKLSLLTKISIASASFFIVFALALAFLVRTLVIQDFQLQSSKLISSFVESQVQGHLNPQIFVHKNRTQTDVMEEHSVFEVFFQEIKTEDQVGARVWDDIGTIIHVHDPLSGKLTMQGVNESYPNSTGYNKAIAGETYVDIGPPHGDSNSVIAQKYPRLIDVFVPVYFPGDEKPIGVVEIIYNTSSLDKAISGVETRVMILTFGIFFGLYIVLFYFTKNASLTLIAQKDALEKSREELEKRVELRTSDLQKTNTALEQKTSALTSAQEHLNDQQLALMNILEDQKELEVELKKSKASVEKQVEERTRQLAEAQAESQSILENAGEGIVVTNQKGEVEYVNPAFTKMTGFSLDDFSGTDFAEKIIIYDLKHKLIPPERRSDAAAVTAKGHEEKIFIEKKDKDKIAVNINTTPIIVDEQFSGVVRIIHDITEDIKLQQQKDDFFSIASHELRTPLTVIAGNIDMLLNGGYMKTQLTQQERELLTDSATAADRLIKLISDFLNVSRLDQGRIKYELAQVDACKVTESVINEMQPLAKEKSLKLEYICSREHGMVIADEGLLREILINLIGNSMKFTSSGGVTVTHMVEGNFLATRVKDTGMGIDKDKQDLLFHRFQQAMNRTLSREAGGTGLGLYISREFAKVMGGDLILENSEKGKGSTFKLTLPFVNTEEGREALVKGKKKH